MRSLSSQNRRGQLNTLIPLIIGIAGLVIVVVIALTITSTLKNAELLSTTRPTSAVTNETGWINTSTYTLDNEKGAETFGFALTAIWGNYPNQAPSNPFNFSIALANASLNSVTGIVTNTSAFNSTVLSNVSFSYTHQTYSTEEFTTNNISANFSSGVGNVSSKIPTILAIAAVIAIIAILVVLVAVWQRMRLGGSTL